MSDHKKEMEVQFEEQLKVITDALKNSPHHLQSWLGWVERYYSAAVDMTKDELALIDAYLKQDAEALKKWYAHRHDHDTETDAFRTVLVELMWKKLSEITDKTQLEWREVTEDLRHHGVYHAGEEVGIGVYTCKHCGKALEIHHPSVLVVCPNCDHKSFTRKALPV